MIKRINKNAQTGLIIVIIIIVIAAIGIGVYYAYKPGQTPSYPTTPTSNTPTPTSATQTLQVSIQNFAFSPSALTINKGDTVKWTNMDSVSHTVTSDSGNELSSGTLSTGQTYSHTFNTAGTFDYHCSIHTMMKGAITVR